MSRLLYLLSYPAMLSSSGDFYTGAGKLWSSGYPACTTRFYPGSPLSPGPDDKFKMPAHPGRGRTGLVLVPSSTVQCSIMRCRLCGADSIKYQPGRWNAWRCPECGYIGKDSTGFPPPEAERNRYLLHDNSLDNQGFRTWLELFIDGTLEPLMSGKGPETRILDYGSGPVPALSMLLKTRGYNPVAYDPFFAPCTRWREEQWDLIVMHEVAEHLRDPSACFQDLAARLGTSGTVVMRTQFLPDEEKKVQSWWYAEDPTHLGFYSRKSIPVIKNLLQLPYSGYKAPDTALFSTMPL